MTHSAFTPDEWRILQTAPLCVLALRSTNSKLYIVTENSATIKLFLYRALEFADKQNAKTIVVDFLFSTYAELENLLGELQRASKSPAAGLQEALSLLINKVSQDEAESAMDMLVELAGSTVICSEWNSIMEDSSILVKSAYKLSLGAKSSSSALVSSPTAKYLSVYLLVDSSRRISDDVRFFNTGIITQFCDPLHTRPKSSVPLTISLIPINETSDLVVPVESSIFHASSLVGTGSCHFGRALLRLHVSLASQSSDAMSLVFIFLSGAPEDAWQKPAKHLQDLAASGKVNVIAVGSGLASALASLKEVGALNPLIMSDITQGNTEQLFKWLYGVMEIVIGELKSGTPAKQKFPPLPACLKTI